MHHDGFYNLHYLLWDLQMDLLSYVPDSRSMERHEKDHRLYHPYRNLYFSYHQYAIVRYAVLKYKNEVRGHNTFYRYWHLQLHFHLYYDLLLKTHTATL